MVKRLSDAQLLARASVGKDRLARFPSSAQRLFEEKLEDIALPTKPEERREFLRSVDAITRNTMRYDNFDPKRLGAKNGLANMFIDHAVKQMDEISRIIRVSERSSNPSGYRKFLAREGFQVREFIGSIDFFRDGRKITFKKVPEEKMAAGAEIAGILKERKIDGLRRLTKILKRDADKGVDITGFDEFLYALWGVPADPVGKLNARLDAEVLNRWKYAFDRGIYAINGKVLSFTHYFTEGYVGAYILSDSAFLDDNEWGGFNAGMDILLPPDFEENALCHERQHVFDRLIGIPSSEYRPELAELVFSPNACFLYDILTVEEISAALGTPELVRRKDKFPKHHEAKERIIDSIGWKPKFPIPQLARRLLNEDYKAACGLTYDEILEPFGR